MRISRRRFVGQLVGLGASAVGAAALGACAPSSNTPNAAKVRRIGFLSGGTGQTTDSDPFRQALSDLGYAEGKDVIIDFRTADGVADLVPGLVSELIGLPADILVTTGSIATVAAKQATSSIPIVFFRVTNPVGQGIVASLSRPGGNITGVAASLDTGPKQLELLREAVPGVRRVAVLLNANNPGVGTLSADTQEAARTWGLELQAFSIHNSEELDAALETIARSRPDALLVRSAFNIYRDLNQIPDFATKMRLPQMYSTDAPFVLHGGLMALGLNNPSLARSAAKLVDKILKGTSPADLPVEQPTQVDFIVNLPAAQKLGLSIPDSVLRQATDVVR